MRKRDEDFQPWQRLSGPLDARRFELFDLAAPVFARHGYRGATIKALAHACGVKPATLYHYFRSKKDLATFPLRGPKLGWEGTYVDPHLDPLVQLRSLVDLAAERLPIYLLAMRMAEEIGEQDGHRQRTTAFREGEAVFGRLIAATAPRIGRSEALDLARHLLSLLVGANIVGLDSEPRHSVRGRMLDALRARLVPHHVTDAAFSRAMKPAS